jgi:hypothetical protein
MAEPAENAEPLVEEEEGEEEEEDLTPEELVEKGDDCGSDDLADALDYYSAAIEKKKLDLEDLGEDEIHPELASFYLKYADALLKEQEALHEDELYHKQEDAAEGELNDMEMTFAMLDMATRSFEKRVEIAKKAGQIDQEAGELLIFVHLRRGDFYCLEDMAEGWIEEAKLALEYVNQFEPENKKRRAEAILPLAMAFKADNKSADALENLKLAKTILNELISEADTADGKEWHQGTLEKVEEMITETEEDIKGEEECPIEQVSEEIKKVATESTSFDAPTRSEEPVQIAVKRKSRDENGSAAKRPNTSDSTAPNGSAAS